MMNADVGSILLVGVIFGAIAGWLWWRDGGKW